MLSSTAGQVMATVVGSHIPERMGMETVLLSKEDYADYTLEESQDRISDGVWITREDQHPI